MTPRAPRVWHERPSRPGHSPQATAARIVNAIVALRKRYPTWGGKKIVVVLGERHRSGSLPADQYGE